MHHDLHAHTHQLELKILLSVSQRVCPADQGGKTIKIKSYCNHSFVKEREARSCGAHHTTSFPFGPPRTGEEGKKGMGGRVLCSCSESVNPPDPVPTHTCLTQPRNNTCPSSSFWKMDEYTRLPSPSPPTHRKGRSRKAKQGSEMQGKEAGNPNSAAETET
jgi:hypothetical protein